MINNSTGTQSAEQWWQSIRSWTVSQWFTVIKQNTAVRRMQQRRHRQHQWKQKKTMQIHNCRITQPNVDGKISLQDHDQVNISSDSSVSW